jgi:L-fuconolactonase
MTRNSVARNSDELTTGNLSIVDTHCHLWYLKLAKQTGLTSEFGPIFRSFSPADLAAVTSPFGISRCVLIESGKTNEETQAMKTMAASCRLISAFMPYVDLASPMLETELDGWRGNPKFRGVRARFEGHPDPDILLRPAVMQGITKLADRGLSLEFLVRAAHLKHILKVYEHIPHLNAVIEHLAKPDLVGGTDRAEWRSSMRALAMHTSVACKLSLSPRVEDLGALLKATGKGWPVESIKPFVGSLLEWFGPSRLMWGSDWPVALLVASYGDTLQAMCDAIGNMPPREEEKLFRTSAMGFYRLGADKESGGKFQPQEVNSR